MSLRQVCFLNDLLNWQSHMWSEQTIEKGPNSPILLKAENWYWLLKGDGSKSNSEDCMWWTLVKSYMAELSGRRKVSGSSLDSIWLLDRLGGSVSGWEV